MSVQSGQIEITKTASPSLSKVGDTVVYTIKICNIGSTPLQLVNVNDPLLGGDITSNFKPTLAPGECDTVTINYVVADLGVDPLINTVTANYVTALSVSESVAVNLFQPSVRIVKSGPAYSKVGDTITYTYVITNISSADSPNLILNSVVDVINNIPTDLTQTAINAGASNLAPGASVTFQSTHLVTASDPNPLINTVVATYNPSGYPNIISDYDNHLVVLVNPNFTVEKNCISGAAVSGGTATFRVNITNTGDVPLNISALDQGKVYTSNGLAPGSIFTFTVPVTVPVGQCGGSITNEVFVVVTLPEIYGLSNTYTASASATCPIVTLGRTRGFWANNNGHAILDPNGDGIINNPVTIGSGPRSLFINTIALSDIILAGNYCSLPGSPCQNNLSDSLKANTLGVLMAQTLALTYNINYIQCYSGQSVSSLGCGNLLIPVGLPSNSTVNDVLNAANILIGNTTASGTVTQDQASAMINLINCLNRETF